MPATQFCVLVQSLFTEHDFTRQRPDWHVSPDFVQSLSRVQEVDEPNVQSLFWQTWLTPQSLFTVHDLALHTVFTHRSLALQSESTVQAPLWMHAPWLQIWPAGQSAACAQGAQRFPLQIWPLLQSLLLWHEFATQRPVTHFFGEEQSALEAQLVQT